MRLGIFGVWQNHQTEIAQSKYFPCSEIQRNTNVQGIAEIPRRHVKGQTFNLTVKRRQGERKKGSVTKKKKNA